MYIAFDLKRDSALGVGATAAWWNHILHQELSIWYQKHTIAYQIKTVKYVTRVVLEPDEMYSFFAMTWNPVNPELRNYRVVEPMKLDNS
jgi:ribosomal protein L5